MAPLREDQAFPADPEEGYGLEKLFMEKLCQYFSEDWKLPTRCVRFHNVYGPLGTYEGGREKAPAAICRKIALCPNGGEIEIWGDGKQTRSFMYVDDCVEGIYRIMRSDYNGPLNLGTDELVSIDDLVDLVAGTAGKTIRKRHDPSRPQGRARPQQRQLTTKASARLGASHQARGRHLANLSLDRGTMSRWGSRIHHDSRGVSVQTTMASADRSRIGHAAADWQLTHAGVIDRNWWHRGRWVPANNAELRRCRSWSRKMK